MEPIRQTLLQEEYCSGLKSWCYKTGQFRMTALLIHLKLKNQPN